MIKKILLAMFATLPFMAVAQQAGTWVLHPYYVGTYLQGLSTMNCIDAGNKIYYLTQGSLYAYDKASETNDVLDLNSSLNDINISQIYYNYNKQYLVVAYNDCNIDIVKASGDVVNIPAIKEVVMTSQKAINDVTFGNGKIYIATSFGYITLDENTLGVDEVRDFQTNIASVAIVGEKKIMSVGNKFYFCNAGDDKETLNDFSSLANSKGAAGRIYTINDSTFFLSIATNASNLTAGTLQVVSVKDEGGTTSFTLKQIAGNMPFSVQPTPAGYVASFGSSNYYYTFDNKGENATRATGNELYTSQEEGNWWVCGASGLAHIVNGVKGEYFLPSGISITKNAYWTVYDPSQQRILLSSTADNQFVSNYSGVKTEVNSYDGSTWRNITPSGVPNNSGNYRLVVSPNEPDTYFYSCRSTGGIVKVQGNKMVANYKASNSPYYEMASPLCFDSKGNLWMVITRNTSNIDAFAITPQNQLSTQVDSSLFVINNMDGACHASNNGHKRTSFDVGAGDIKVFTAGEWGHPLLTGGNCLERLLHIERTRVSHFFTRVYGKEENGLIIIYGDVKPFGPFKQCLIDSFEDPTRNTSFSLRSAAKPIGQSADGIVQKRMIALVTFDAVDGPGFLMASKRFRDPDVATESLHPHVSDNIIQVDFSVNKKQFLDSVEYRKAAGFESFEVLDQRVLDAFGCDKVTIKETTTLTAVGHNQFVNEAGKNVSLFDACFGS